MYKFVKNLFFTICIVSFFWFILHLNFLINVKLYGRKCLRYSPSSLLLKYKETSSLSPIKTTRKEKVHKLGKDATKKTVKAKEKKEKTTQSSVTKSPQMKISLSMKSNDNLQDNRTLLAVLATSWLPENEKTIVHENVARVWGTWSKIVQPVVYTNLSMTDKSFEQCIKSGLKLLPILKTKCNGVPVLNVMVTNLLKKIPNSDFYGFVNSDILFDPGLIETFNFVKSHIKERPVLLIGRRTNVDFTGGINVYSPKEVPGLAKKGKLIREWAIDYFLTDRSFPWDKLPDFVIGRYHYDNYVVYFSLTRNITVIDVTQTVTAIHQTTKDGNDAGHNRHDTNCNRRMIWRMGKPFLTRWGYVTCARKYTHRDKSGNVTISIRNPWNGCMGASPLKKH